MLHLFNHHEEKSERSHHRVLLMFSMVIIAAIGFVMFTFSYRQLTHERLIEYVEAITDCTLIVDESACGQHIGCESIYQTSCADCTDKSFVRCVEIDTKLAAQLDARQQLCEDTDGLWYTNQLGHFCLCDVAASNAVFIDGQGCTIQ